MVRLPVVFWFVVPLITGIIVDFYSKIAVPILLPIFLIGVLSALKIPKLSRIILINRLFNILVPVLFFVFGMALAGVDDPSRSPEYFANQLGENSHVLIRLIEMPEEKENSWKCDAEILGVDGKSAIGRSLIYFSKTEKSKTIQYGDILLVKNRFDSVKNNGNPDEFDYKNYLRTKGIFHRAFLDDDMWHYEKNSANFLKKTALGIRTEFENRIDSTAMTDANKQIAKALIMGSRDNMDAEIEDSFSRAGVTHILSVSGLHVGILMVILNFLFKPFHSLPKGKLICSVLVGLAIWTFAAISGMSPPVNRAATMFTFILIGQNLQRETSISQSVLVSAFILILIEPYVIFDVGFQLSYSAVLGIIHIHPLIYNQMTFRFSMVDKLWQITSVSLAAQLATLPAVLFYFHQFPNYFILSNLVVIPLSFLVLAVGVAYLIFAKLPWLSDSLEWMMNFILNILNGSVSLVDGLPYAVSEGYSFTAPEALALYAVLALTLTAITFKRKKLLWVSLTCAVLFSFAQLFSSLDRRSENEIVFYNAMKTDAIDIFHGTSCVNIATGEFYENRNQNRYVAMNHRAIKTGFHEPSEILDMDKQFRPVEFGMHQLSFVSDTLIRNEGCDSLALTDYIYLFKTKFVPENLVNAWQKNGSTIVIGSGVAYGVSSFLRKKLDEEHLHDLKTEGALVINF